jgi:hypothetical protein
LKRLKHFLIISVLVVAIGAPKPAKADLFGGDVVVLVKILANAIQQLIQLKQILSTSSDTLGILKDINAGIKHGLSIIHMINPKFNPGIYGSLADADQVLAVIEDLYGVVPETAEARLQQAHDQSVAESISMNGALFNFADQADEESRRIMAHSQVVNQNGAAKLTAQSVAVLISVSTQVLRTNSMMLKMLGEDIAMKNRQGKLESAQFKTQYESLSTAFGGLPQEPKLQPLVGK